MVSNFQPLYYQRLPKRYREIVCVARNCFHTDRRDPSLSFFSFPIQNKELFDKWAQNCKLPDTFKYDSECSKDLALCAEHFEDKFFVKGKKQLRKRVKPVPTIFQEPEIFSINCHQHENVKYTTNSPEPVPDSNECESVDDPLAITEPLNNIRIDFCRLCAEAYPIEELISIYNDENSSKYTEMLEICIPNKVRQDDKLPQNVCKKCITHLENCSLTLRGFLQADVALKKIFYSGFNSEVENEMSTKIKVRNLGNLSEKMVSEVNAEHNYALLLELIADNDDDNVNCDASSETNSVSQEITSDNKAECTTETETTIEPEENETVPKPSEEPFIPSKLDLIIYYECMLCSVFYRLKTSVLRHIKLHHKEYELKQVLRELEGTICHEQQISCVKCDLKFNTLQKYRQHAYKHRSINCIDKDCEAEFSKFDHYYKHLKEVHKQDEALHCTECSMWFDNKVDLKEHELLHEKEEMIVTCETCNMTFNSRFELRKHKRKHGTILCNECGKVFVTYQYLRVHQKIHTNRRAYACNKCPKCFNTRGGLSRHMLRHTAEMVVCQVCGVTLRATSMKQHMQVHTSGKMHRCNLCSMSFRRLWNLKSHQLATHTKLVDKDPKAEEVQQNLIVRLDNLGKSFECLVCGKRFAKKVQFVVHYRIHTGIRPYACDTCDKTFRTANTMKQHRVTHFDEYPHKCEVCKRGFKRINYLMTHRLLHTGEKPHACPECNRAFVQRTDMMKHYRNHSKNKFKIRTRKMTEKSIGINKSDDESEYSY